jgi:phosphoglycerate kinase
LLQQKKTIDKITNDGGTAILMSHLGRPKGNDPELSLSHIVEAVEDALGKPILFSSQVIGKETLSIIKDSEPGQVILLENLRYHTEEEKGDVSFAKELSFLADSYVNDAFGTAHRAHASTSVVAGFF